MIVKIYRLYISSNSVDRPLLNVWFYVDMVMEESSGSHWIFRALRFSWAFAVVGYWMWKIFACHAVILSSFKLILIMLLYIFH